MTLLEQLKDSLGPEAQELRKKQDAVLEAVRLSDSTKWIYIGWRGQACTEVIVIETNDTEYFYELPATTDQIYDWIIEVGERQELDYCDGNVEHPDILGKYALAHIKDLKEIRE